MSPKSVWGLESWLLCPDLTIFQWKCCVLSPPRSAAVSKPSTNTRRKPCVKLVISDHLRWENVLYLKPLHHLVFIFSYHHFHFILTRLRIFFFIFKHDCKQLFLFNKAITASLFIRRRGRSWNSRGCLRSWITVINRWSSTCPSQAPIVRATAYQHMMLFLLLYFYNSSV